MSRPTRRNKGKSKQDDMSTKDRFLQIREQYKEASKKKGFNALIYGDFGTGKTYLLSTAPKPVLVHAFDPGGPMTLRKWIESGEVLVKEFIPEEGEEQDAYIRWEKEFQQLRKEGFFENIGTYCVDSLTTMSESLMEAIMVRGETKKGKRKPYHEDLQTFTPQLQDYQVQQYTLRDVLNLCCGLPCNFICTGHIDRSKDEVSGEIIATPMITGKFAQKIPMLFDEVYITKTKETRGGLQYKLLTQSTGIYRARSRLAASYDISKHEEPNIKQILKKCNYEYEDKPLFLDNETE